MIKSLRHLGQTALDALAWRVQSSGWRGGKPPPKLKQTQELFCQWNAEQLGITLAESRARYLDSWQAIRHGHGGSEYRQFCDTSYRLFRVFFDDNSREVFASYQFHGPLHLLRMLSYGDSPWPADHPAVQALAARESVTILDFGCGLAHVSRGLATTLRAQGKSVQLVLADIPTVRKDFLVWMCAKIGLPATFLDCTPGAPLPPLPPCDVCVATEVLEHLHDPLPYLEALHAALAAGGFLRTNVADHPAEYGHVTTNLEPAREKLRAWRYEELQPHRLFRKPSA
jgi:SAM-dependent methyltransferase